MNLDPASFSVSELAKMTKARNWETRFPASLARSQMPETCGWNLVSPSSSGRGSASSLGSQYAYTLEDFVISCNCDEIPARSGRESVHPPTTFHKTLCSYFTLCFDCLRHPRSRLSRGSSAGRGGSEFRIPKAALPEGISHIVPERRFRLSRSWRCPSLRSECIPPSLAISVRTSVCHP
jgi:hypothetical protein